MSVTVSSYKKTKPSTDKALPSVNKSNYHLNVLFQYVLLFSILLNVMFHALMGRFQLELFYEGQSISNASYFFLLYFSRKLKYNYIA